VIAVVGDASGKQPEIDDQGGIRQASQGLEACIAKLAQNGVLVMRNGKIDVAATDTVLDDRPVNDVDPPRRRPVRPASRWARRAPASARREPSRWSSAPGCAGWNARRSKGG
jgi:hypothetical protein